MKVPIFLGLMNNFYKMMNINNIAGHLKKIKSTGVKHKFHVAYCFALLCYKILCLVRNGTIYVQALDERNRSRGSFFIFNSTYSKVPKPI